MLMSPHLSTALLPAVLVAGLAWLPLKQQLIKGEAGASPGSSTSPTQKADNAVTVNANYSNAAVLGEILKRHIRQGLPGASLAVYSEPEGWWACAQGYARTESKTPMRIDHLHYLQSASKTYMAVSVLKLYEEQRIQLDAPVTKYLPAKYSKYIKRADRVSVRMLLTHTTGIPEYSTHPEFVSQVILNPKSVFGTEDVLKHLGNEEPAFPPGTRYAYTNTNYLLLALIVDAIAGDHAEVIDRTIFKKLRLTRTFYRNKANYLHSPDLVDSYWDVLDTGRPANISPLQRANVATLIGDDGIVCAPIDAVLFLKGLNEGKLLKESTFRLMRHWVKDEKGKPVYGMGLSYFEAGDASGYGHGGGGIGAGCLLLHVPSRRLYLFLATNVGVLTEGKLSRQAEEMQKEVLHALLK
jgi:D-alanyl-D-alanine carboxypeptidase